MTARLPIIGGDDGNWGNILNDFLQVSHNNDGTLKGGAVGAGGALLAANNLSDIQSASVARTNLGLGSAATQASSAFDAAGAATAAQNASVPVAGGAMSGWLAPAVIGLSFGSNISLDASKGNVFTLTLTASTGTIENPSNPTNGQHILVCIAQGSGGGFTVSFGNAFNFGGTGQPTLSTTPGDTDVVGFVYLSSLSQWLCVGSAMGF